MLNVVLLVTVLSATSSDDSFDHRHQAFDLLLQRYVRNGSVSYGALLNEHKALQSYTRTLGAVSPAALKRFSREQALAFWINAYNAFTLQLILNHPSVASIRDIRGAWDEHRFEVAGRGRTLNEIEHAIIRREFDEPLIHMVLVCAARSCPVLDSRAFTADDLDARLAAAARRFANDPEKNSFRDGGLAVSPIFEWYGQDFIHRYAPKGSKDPQAAIRGFFSQTLGRPIPPDTPVTYRGYDWRLNGSW